MHIALPKQRYSSILDISPDELRKIGAKALAFDLDNTTVYDSSYRIYRGCLEWVQAMKNAGFPIMIITNTHTRRAKKLAKIFDVDYIGPARKPAIEGFLEAARRMNVNISELAMIGDQLFKDIEGANRAGAISIWVRPFMTEKLLYFYYKKIRKKEKALFAKHNIEY